MVFRSCGINCGAGNAGTSSWDKSPGINALHAMFVFLLILPLTFCLVGCNNKSALKGLAPCSGTVMMDGQPVANASITFFPTGGGDDLRTATAQTDAQGKFSMMTLQPGDGVKPGEYAATVVKKEPIGPEPKPEIDDNGNEYIPSRPTKHVLPEKYANPASAKLDFTIPAGGNKNLEIVLEK